MTEKLLFAYQGAGKEAERFMLRLRNGLVEITVRGEPQIRQVTDAVEGLVERATEGPTAVMTLPLSTTAELLHALLHVPPTAELLEKLPFVTWFDDAADRNAFIAAVQRVNPRLVELREKNISG